MYPRTLEATIKEISCDFPVLLITGPRQVGKTTILNLCKDESRSYVSLDDLNTRFLAQNDPELFIQIHKSPIIIDEIQYAPNLLTYIKTQVDTQSKNGMYWLAGSQKFELMKNITESLAGRVAILDLLGLSHNEENMLKETLPFLPTNEWRKQSQKKKTETIESIYHRIWQGSFPKAINMSSKSRDIFYKSYVQTYIQRDVADIINIQNNGMFFKFICLIAARIGQQLNYNNIAADTGIDSKTVKSWLSILQTSGLIYLLKPYASNLNKRLTKTPKIYFLDTGLCAHLTNWSSPQSLKNGIMSGAILETYIFSEILKSYWHNGINPNIYYYRDADKKEIDLLIEINDTLYPIELKRTATPSLQLTKSFGALNKLGKNIGNGTIICFVKDVTHLSSNIIAVPIHYI